MLQDYNLDDPQDCARFQVNLMLADLHTSIHEGLILVHREDVPVEVALKLVELDKLLKEIDRLTAPGYQPTTKDVAIYLLGQ